MKLNTKILADIFQSNMILPLNKDFKLGGVVDPKKKLQLDSIKIIILKPKL